MNIVEPRRVTGVVVGSVEALLVEEHCHLIILLLIHLHLWLTDRDATTAA
jgi:hypothetical protein